MPIPGEVALAKGDVANAVATRAAAGDLEHRLGDVDSEHASPA
jgi:hypothetical protein